MSRNILIALAACSSLAQAYDCATVDAALRQQFAILEPMVDSPAAYDENKANAAHTEIRRLLTTDADKSWDCDFPQAREQGLQMATASDRKFRAYSWDDASGGTMRFNLGLWQYRDATGKTRVIDAHPEWEKREDVSGNSDNVTGLYTADLGERGTVYLLEESAQGSSNALAVSLQLLRVQGDKPEAAALVRSHGKDLSSIAFAYDRDSLPGTTSQYPHFGYDAASKTLRVPLIENTQKFPDGEVTGKTLDYRYDGTHFVYVKDGAASE